MTSVIVAGFSWLGDRLLCQAIFDKFFKREYTAL